MALYEFECPVHGKFERVCNTSNVQVWPCPFRMNEYEEPFGDYCPHNAPRVEFSLPAKRNPRYGEG